MLSILCGCRYGTRFSGLRGVDETGVSAGTSSPSEGERVLVENEMVK